MIGMYQPRSRKQAFADALAAGRRTLTRATQTALMRGAGGLLFLAAAAALVALASYNSTDPSLNNATNHEPSNWLGGLGAATADQLLEYFGLAALAFLAPPAVWGARALAGKRLRHAMWRAIAWPLGTLFVAAGLGALTLHASLPAGAGGLIGIAVERLSIRVAEVDGVSWLRYALPGILFTAGLPLAFMATGLRPGPIWRGIVNVPATFLWLGGLLRTKNFSFRRARVPTYDDHDPEYDTEDFEDGDEDAYALSEAPEPLTAYSEDARAKNRIQREEARKVAVAASKRPRQPALNLSSGEYQLPALGLLAEAVHLHDRSGLSDEALEENARMLEAVLADFGVKGRVMAVRPGPVVTLYEFEPAAGVKSSRVISLADDVARSMSAVAARIATIPGRNVMGIELPNPHRDTVFLRELVSSNEYEKARAPLILALGKTIGGEPVMADLAKMPHLLIAGTTGSGKSVALNTMILSLLYRMAPEHCRMIMIDPKMLELSVYEGIPHLLTPVVTDPRKAVVALKWAVREMEERYRKMSKLGVRGVEAFNERVLKAKDKGDTLKRTVQTGFDRDTGKPIYEDETLEFEPMPYIVIVVDEVADLMMISGKEIEGAVQRLAQMARI